MRFKFKVKKLAALYTDEKGAQKYPSGVVQAFFEVMMTIESAQDERDLYALKSLHFEQLKGARGQKGHRSIRLNEQYRLILTLEKDQEGQYLWIISLEKHYQ